MYNKQVAALYVVNLCINFGCQRGFLSVATLFGLRMKKLLVFSLTLMMTALNSIKPVVTKVEKLMSYPALACVRFKMPANFALSE